MYFLKTNKVSVPAKKTYYYCDLFEFPEFDAKTHLVQFEMVINPKNFKNLHHLLVYECYSGFNKTEELARECGQVRLPSIIGHYCMNKLIIAWAVGGDLVRGTA